MSDLTQLRRLARTKHNALVDSDPIPRHQSHYAVTALEDAATQLGFSHYGVEGFCDECGSRGVTYLNTGDTYIPTVYAVTNRYSARYYVGTQEDMLCHGIQEAAQ
jgi:hypothetical protein